MPSRPAACSTHNASRSCSRFSDSYFDLLLLEGPAVGSAAAAGGSTSVVGGVLVLVGGKLEPGARRSRLKHALETIPALKLGMIMAAAAG